MRLEVRKSAGHKCEKCGSFDLIPGAEKNLNDIIEEEWKLRESELMDVHGRTLVHTIGEWGNEVNRVMSETVPSAWRFNRRAWHERLQKKLADAMAEVKTQTRFELSDVEE